MEEVSCYFGVRKILFYYSPTLYSNRYMLFSPDLYWGACMIPVFGIFSYNVINRSCVKCSAIVEVTIRLSNIHNIIKMTVF